MIGLGSFTFIVIAIIIIYMSIIYMKRTENTAIANFDIGDLLQVLAQKKLERHSTAIINTDYEWRKVLRKNTQKIREEYNNAIQTFPAKKHRLSVGDIASSVDFNPGSLESSG